MLAAKAGATYVSPFVGRLDDICENGVGLIGDIVRMYRTYDYKTQVLAASIRNTKHIIECVEMGADVATCPLSAIKGLLNHPLTDSGLKKFLEDYKRNKETRHPYAAKTDCLLVRGDFNTFFSDSSVTEYYWSSSRNGF